MPIPAVLTDPPWRRASTMLDAHAASSPKEVRAAPTRLDWEDGERERFRGPISDDGAARLRPEAEERMFEKLLDELDKLRPLRAVEIARLGDEKLGELAQELGPTTCDVGMMKLILGRLGDAFVEQAVTIVRAAPRERALFEAAMPIRAGDLARTASTILFEREIPTSFDVPPSVAPSEAWLLRHAETAAAALIPAAAGGGVGVGAQKAARAALAFIAARGGMEAMRDVVEPHGELAAWLDPIAALAPLASSHPWLALIVARGIDHRAVALAGDEASAKAYIERVRAGDEQKKLRTVPFAVAPLPAFFDVAALPRVTLADGTPLPDDALRALGEMLRFSPLLNPYVGIEQVRAACDAASLDAFALDLLARWRAAGEDPRDVWALEACGKIGGETCAREVATCVRGWARGATAPRHGWDQESHRVVMLESGSRGWAYARTGCAVLSAFGTDFGAMLLGDLARTGVQIWLRKEAQRLVGGEEVSQDETEAQVPTVGLDADGSAKLDTGIRVYRLGFDEGLTPFLVDEEGARIESFPRLRKDMDAAKHAAAKERYAAIVKDVKVVARYQVALLERTMCTQRAMPASVFRERFIEHPLLRHLGRRVVWRAGASTFRVSEDGSLADVNDATLALPEGADVTVAHPITMGEADRTAWRTRFADYRIMQPFPQLGRELFTVAPDGIGERDIEGAVGIHTTHGRLFQLGRRGWRMRHRDDASEYERELPCGAAARFDITPQVGQGGTEDQVFTIAAATCTYALDRLPAIDYSELFRDFDYLGQVR